MDKRQWLHAHNTSSRKASLTLIVLLFSLNSIASTPRRDGNWWRDLTAADKATYMTGFFDGTHLGQDLSVWKLSHKKVKLGIGNPADSFQAFENTGAKNATNIQIADGLDAFYSDYRNRSIRIHDAVWLVLNGIAGTEEETLDKMTEDSRRAASK